MPSSKTSYSSHPASPSPVVKEGDIEDDFIAKLTSLKYKHRPDIRDRDALEANFREKFQALNAVTLTDSEFARLLDEITTPDVFKSAQILRTRNSFERDDGTPLNFTLVNIKDWCKNTFEVVNQLRINTRSSHHRYDVILLINGIPVVQIELKTLDVSPRRAMQQIVDYKKDPGNGYTNTLLSFMQLFIVSNRSDTCYFANNNNRHFAFDVDEKFLPVYQFADRDNQKITRLDQFADHFLPKCTLGETISRYMVLVASEQKMLMMRPYQIYAVKDIINCIHQNSGNGYIWHTTGSGKTLTSFKASTLLKDNPDIEKCLFVVDRKDLDRQTREEFNKFQAGCVEENTNTATLVRRLLSDDYADKVIVTTIQKLGIALNEGSPQNQQQKQSKRATYKEQLAPLRDQRIVFIFDECHRSQFGENHRAIKAFFPNSQLFGFTGTPIFEQNATARQIEGDELTYKTTADIFEKELHSYTITNAIEDRNVLKFQIDYFKPEGETALKPGEPLAKQAVIEAILARHHAVTAGRKFNALFATASINDAIEYYQLFRSLQAQRQADDPDFRPLNIACAFSPPAEGDKDVKQLQEDLPQEKADNKQEPDKKKAALEAIIQDYNTQYSTNHRITEFDAYYQDVQDRIKSQQFPNSDHPHSEKIDITIVVDMLLTGFDSKYLNTLYCDKKLKYHGLIQAFSRTNRVLNDTKPSGKILDFRQQQDAVDEAIKLFSGGQGEAAAREIWLVDPAPVVIGQLGDAVNQLGEFMKSQSLSCAPEDVPKLKGDIARSQFVQKFKEVQRLKTQLDQYTDLSDEQQTNIEATLPAEQHRAFRGVYIDTAHALKKVQDTGGDNTPPEVEELDFEFVLFASATIDYDYIMELLANYSQEAPGKQKMTREQVISLIASDAKFADQRDDITAYINQLKPGGGLSKEQIVTGYETFKTENESKELQTLAKTHGLEASALEEFVTEILHRFVFDGQTLTDLMAPLDLGWKERRTRELALMAELVPLLKKRANQQIISGLSGYES
ncbi:MAG: type I restriction endonuclease subunit R [Verrucomicrobiales bacterium]|nr:type I restriction endonuclease subunit R [Verrucomicrobiales bacterium]